ncbi:DUF624 domain-containing protein [Caldifermentibacillus hisashii]|uniref:YesL family protein n=1 Tax=Caldifermentibacillus hisashii TaxID=996558 RepID=UPI0031FC28A0
MNIFTNGMYRFCVWVTRLVYLNILWIVFSLVGLVAFSFFPATIAMYTVVREWITGKTDIKVLNKFFETFKSEFKNSNVLGYILLLVGSILFLDLKIINMMENQLLLMLFTALILVFIMALSYIFPIYVHFDIPLLKVFKYSFIISLSRPLYTCLMLFGALGTVFVILLHDLSLILFSGSLFSLVNFIIALRTFNSFSEKITISNMH